MTLLALLKHPLSGSARRPARTQRAIATLELRGAARAAPEAAAPRASPMRSTTFRATKHDALHRSDPRTS